MQIGVSSFVSVLGQTDMSSVLYSLSALSEVVARNSFLKDILE